eukprot:GHVH01008149.1.p1 GENE.GHVH01008149.1~~GHVH01008149.1.p1  ORF type:complete len:206 (-),score=25.65 GHVH01008149.1:81-698(-)
MVRDSGDSMSATSMSAFDLEEFYDDLMNNWSTSKGAALLDSSAIRFIETKWARLPDQRRIRTLMSFFHLKSRVRLESQDSLYRIVDRAEKDSNEFLVKLARLLRSFVSTGVIDVTETDSETAWRLASELENDLDYSVSNFSLSSSFPWLSIVPSNLQVDGGDSQAGASTIKLFQNLDSLREHFPYEIPSKVNILINDILQDNPMK